MERTKRIRHLSFLLLALSVPTAVTLWYSRDRTSPQDSQEAKSVSGSRSESSRENVTPVDPSGSKFNQVTASQGINPMVLTLLLRPQPWSYKAMPRPSEVPLLDPVTQAEVIRRFQTPGSPTNKLMLIAVLAFGGDAQVVPVFARALTNDYAGRRLTDAEHSVMCAMLDLLGVTARRVPEATVFLEQASHPVFWGGVTLWSILQDHSEDWTQRSLVTSAIKALAWSQRPEAEQMLRSFRDNPSTLLDAGCLGALVDAAFIHSTVASQGFERSWDLMHTPVGNGESYFTNFQRWAHGTAEGKAWYEWAGRVTQAAWRARKDP